MYVLVAYDVSTVEPAGRKRLRQAARACMDFGQRVQNSLFECKVDPAQWAELRHRLMVIIDPQADSLRFYMLGKNWKSAVEHLGAKPGFDIEGPLIA